VAVRVWDDEMQSVAESVLQSLAGPGAVIVPNPAKKDAAALSDDQLDQMARRFVRP